MIENVYQTDSAELKEACLFMCIAYCSPKVFKDIEGLREIRAAWQATHKLDFFDKKDNLVNYNGLLRYFGVNARYDDKHHRADETIPDNVKFVIGCFQNNAFKHFVVLDKQKQLVYDPMKESITVKNGYLQSMRWFI